ncbi:glycosyltransferase [uncultured Cytophaga sp.]|uniref:glycosyltransferase family 2 protein n=1 Tax=uncultured Cytophaga sp. TaxID=160238 RepID=UPI002604CEC6|nr:glycosyltransferase [uncultured Cytophaga sp.]
MNNTPHISIITPVWNGLPLLQECIESVLNQSYTNWELLISDDGSTDASREYLRSLTDPRIRIFYQETNLGIFGNLNALFQEATGEYTQLLCQDDYFTSSQSLQSIHTYWEQAPADIAFVRFNYESVGKNLATIFKAGKVPGVIYPSQAALCFFTSGNIPGNLSNISLRTSLIGQIGGFRLDMPYAGDFEAWARIAGKHPFGIDAQNLVFVRRHPGAASNFLNKQGEIIRQKARIVNRLFGKLANQEVYSVFLLKLMGTLVYDSLERWVGFKSALRGNDAYLKELDRVVKESDFVFSSATGRWAVFMCSFGGRIGRKFLASVLKKKHNQQYPDRSL